MPFDKIPKTRRTKSVAKVATDEDEVDACAFQRSANIARPADAVEFHKIVQDSGEDRDSGLVLHHFLIKSEVDKYTLRQLESTQVENEDFVAKHDDVDYPAKVEETKVEGTAYTYTYCEMFWSLVAIGSYVIDIGSDVFMAYMYFNKGYWWWFGLTVGFALVSSLTITVVSLTWYKQDQLSEHKQDQLSEHKQDQLSEHKQDQLSEHKQGQLSEHRECKTSRAEWICRIVLHVLQLGPVVRYSYTIWYGLQSRRAEKSKSLKERNYWHLEKAFEDTDATLLRLFECYLEAAPQLTLQLYIIMAHGFAEPIYFAVGQVVSCVSSLTSIAWALTSYHAALRYSLFHKSNMDNSAIIIMFLWRLCSVTARVLAFALFAFHFGFYITAVIGFHIAMVFLWVLFQQTTFCGSQAFEVLFGLVVALLNMFDYFNLTEGHTRLRYLLFYILIFAENLAMTLIFFLAGPATTRPYVYPVMASILALHLIAIAIQVLYYLRFHPNNSSKDGSNRIQRRISCFALVSECCPQPEQRDRKITENRDL